MFLPLAVEKSPLAIVPSPIAVERFPLAVVSTPIAVEYFPLAVVPIPIATEKLPLAVFDDDCIPFPLVSFKYQVAVLVCAVRVSDKKRAEREIKVFIM